MMNKEIKYRIAIKVGYYEALFEFDNLTEAGEFAKTILMHQVENEDTKKKTQVNISAVDYAAEEENTDE